jgi:hypothetical protein
MSNSTEIVRDAPANEVTDGGALNAFASASNFATAQRIARALASSTLVPEAYRGENNIANCLIAIEVASRVGASVFMVMQSLDVIHGRPSFRSKFLIATVNACGKFTPLRFRWEGAPFTDAWGARAVAKDKETGEECLGALITIGLAKAEGWYGRNGSKWKTMPEQMIMYRSASFWANAYAPELSLGMQTTDEVLDTPDLSAAVTTSPAAELEAKLAARKAQAANAVLYGIAAKPPEEPKTTAPAPQEPTVKVATPRAAEAPTWAEEAEALETELARVALLRGDGHVTKDVRKLTTERLDRFRKLAPKELVVRVHKFLEHLDAKAKAVAPEAANDADSPPPDDVPLAFDDSVRETGEEG